RPTPSLSSSVAIAPAIPSSSYDVRAWPNALRLSFVHPRTSAHASDKPPGKPELRARDQHFLGMADELQRARFPRVLQGKGAAGFARHLERAEAGGAQIIVEPADRMVAHPVL